MKISCITPSIRPDGLAVTFKTLQAQTFNDFEWLPRLSIPGEKPDLCYQMNQALKEANGELIVFLQDWIEIAPDGLEKAWEAYGGLHRAWTFPVGKVRDLSDALPSDKDVRWDWRADWEREHPDGLIDYQSWEIDYGSVPRELLERVYLARGYYFNERYDEGFGWENVELALELKKAGAAFMVDGDNKAIAWDHDAFIRHPYKDKPNADLWAIHKQCYERSDEATRGADSPLVST